MSTQSIHFINRYPVITTTAAKPSLVGKIPGKQECQWRFTQVDFKLGPGPCGKVVTALDVEVTDTIMRIEQSHDDGTFKTFIYQLSDIAGRIVVEDDGKYEVDYV